MTFKERRFECDGCGRALTELRWDGSLPDPCVCNGGWHETPLTLSLARHTGVIDDQLEGGARWCETLGHQPVWLDGTKSQWRRVTEEHKKVNIVRHDSQYYAKQRKMHDEKLRDTGSAY
jgi:hypothetical protein